MWWRQHRVMSLFFFCWNSRLQTEQEFHLSRMRPYVAQNQIILGMPGQKKSLLETSAKSDTVFFFSFSPEYWKCTTFTYHILKPQLQADVKFTMYIHGPQRMNPLCCGHTMITLRSKCNILHFAYRISNSWLMEMLEAYSNKRKGHRP